MHIATVFHKGKMRKVRWIWRKWNSLTSQGWSLITDQLSTSSRTTRVHGDLDPGGNYHRWNVQLHNTDDNAENLFNAVHKLEDEVDKLDKNWQKWSSLWRNQRTEKKNSDLELENSDLDTKNSELKKEIENLNITDIEPTWRKHDKNVV